MANLPGFTELDDKARKSPLGFGYFNALALNELAIDGVHTFEHLDSGEHNAAEIARTLGLVRYAAGYTLSGFNAYASLAGGAGVYNPAVGTLILTVSSGALTDGQIPVQVTNASPTGTTKPTITTAYATSDTTIEFHSRYLTSALGAGNAWAAQDASFSAAVHSAPLQDTAYVGPTVPSPLRRGDFLTEDNFNNHALASAYLRTRFLTTHSIGGAHNVKEVAKAYGHLTFSGGAYSADSDSVGFGTITTTSTGILSVAFSPTLTTPVCVLAMADLCRTTGDLYAVVSTPSTMNGSSVSLYVYGFDGTNWNRSDADIWLAVYGA